MAPVQALTTSSRRWRSPLLWLVLGAFIFEALSGFFIFFISPLIEAWLPQFVFQCSFMHWLIGLQVIIPYGLYQLRHYLRVKNLKHSLHYQLGRLTFVSFLIVTLSGIPLFGFIGRDLRIYRYIELTHTISSFAFLVLISGHLVLVYRKARQSARTT